MLLYAGGGGVLYEGGGGVLYEGGGVQFLLAWSSAHVAPRALAKWSSTVWRERR